MEKAGSIYLSARTPVPCFGSVEGDPPLFFGSVESGQLSPQKKLSRMWYPIRATHLGSIQKKGLDLDQQSRTERPVFSVPALSDPSGNGNSSNQLAHRVDCRFTCTGSPRRRRFLSLFRWTWCDQWCIRPVPKVEPQTTETSCSLPTVHGCTNRAHRWHTPPERWGHPPPARYFLGDRPTLFFYRLELIVVIR